MRAIFLCLCLVSPATLILPASAQREQIPEDPVAAALRKPPATGILVLDIEPGSPADRAGLAPGDVIAFYNEQEVTTLEQLQQRLFESRNLQEVRAVVYRGKEAYEAKIPAGPLGIEGRAVTKGQGSQVFHRPRYATPDFSILAREEEDWRAFFFGARKAGWVRERRRPEGELLHIDMRWRAMGAGQEVDLRVTGMFRLAGLLELQSIKVVRNGLTHAEGQRSGSEWVATVAQQTVRLKLPETPVLPNLAVGHLARALPLKRGTCVHFTRLEETEMRLVRGCELYCTGEEDLALPGGLIRAFRFEQFRYGEPVYTYWVDREHRLVRARYGGPSDQLVTREQALEGIPRALLPD